MKKLLLLLLCLSITSTVSAQPSRRIMDKDGHALNINSDGSLPATLSGDINITGTIEGRISVTLDTTATIVLTSADCLQAVRVNNDNDAIDYTLPNAETGLSIVVQSMFAQVVTIDCFDGGESITLDDTTLTAGNAIDSPGTKGDYILLIAISDTQWVSMGRSGAWIDGGAD